MKQIRKRLLSRGVPNFIEVRYRVKLNKILSEITNDALLSVLPVIKADEVKDSFGTYLGDIIQSLIERWTGIRFRRFAESVARTFVDDSEQFAKRTFNTVSARDVGITAYNTPEIQRVLDLATKQNAQLITSIASQHLNAIADIVFANVNAGLRPSEIEEKIRAYGVTKSRARLIARDQTSKVLGAINKAKLVDAGFEFFKWDTSHDERVRPSHKKAQNTVTKYGIGVYRWDDLPTVDGVKTFPSQPINCFPSSAKVNIFYGVEKLFRRFYSGELVEIVTDNGVVLQSTPNHPILTEKGFVSAQSLDVGDNIFYVPNQRIFAGEVNGKSSDISFGKLFSAFHELFGLESRALSGGDFYGDATINENVDIVSVDWILMNNLESSRTKLLCEKFLARAEEVFCLVDEPLDGFFVEACSAFGLTSDGLVSLSSKFISFFNSCLAHSDEHGLASIRLLYSSFIQDSGDNITRDFVMFGNAFDANATKEHRLNFIKRYLYSVVCLDFISGDFVTPCSEAFTNNVGVDSYCTTSISEGIPIKHKMVGIKNKRRISFSGHVYDLQMKNGLFVVESIAVSNCRCVALPVAKFEVEDFQKRKAK